MNTGELAVPDHIEHTKDEAAGLYKKVAWRIMPFLLLCYVISYLDRVNISFAKLQFMEDLKFDDAAYGLGAGLFYVGYLVFEVPSNLYMQKIGARGTMMRIMVLWGVVSIAMAWVSTPMELYIARFLLGAAEAGFFPGVILYMTYWFPAAYRAKMTALFFMGIPLSGLIGGPLAGAIMEGMHGLHGMKGWQLLFIYEGLPAVFLGLFAFFYLKDRPEDAHWLTPREKQILRHQLDEDQQIKAAKLHGGYGALLRDPRIYVAILVYAAFTCATVAIAVWAPTLIKGLKIDDVSVIGWLSALPYIAAALGMFVIGRSSDRLLERRWHTAASLGVAGVGFFLLGAAEGSVVLTIALLGLAAAGLYGGLPVFWSIPAGYLPRAVAPGGIALISSVGVIGAISGTALIGWVKTLTGSLYFGLGAVGAVMMLGAITLLIGFPAKALRERGA